MKKTLLVATMLLGMLSAKADFVSSENIYGIINIPTIIGMNAIGINLDPMPGDTAAIENIVPTNGLTAAATMGDADKLYVLNGTDYTIYWLNNSSGIPVWNNTEGSPESPEVAPGNALWIKKQTAGTVYQIGMVATNASISVELIEGNNFIANPFPADFNLAEIAWTGVAAAGKYDIDTADLILTWNGTESGYDTFYYVNAIATHPQSIPGWYNANKNELAPEIPAGEGFWFIRQNALETPIAVSNPITE